MVNVKVMISKEPSLFDEKIGLIVKGLLPMQDYSFHSSTYCGKDYFECFSLYTSDCDGVIDFAKQYSYGGSYKGTEPMGLLWALQSITDNNMPKRLLKRDVTIPLLVEVNIHKGWVKSLQEFHLPILVDYAIVKSFTITRVFMAPGVRRINVRERNGVRGALFLPPQDGLFPGVISMYGGMPGTLEYKSALLASRGFAALALPYHGVDGLPDDWLQLEMEYFEKSLQFMQAHEEVNGALGIGVIGICKGGQIALSMADSMSGVNCVIAINCAPYSAHNDQSYGDEHRKGIYAGMDLDESFKKLATVTASGSVITRYTFPTCSKHPAYHSLMFNFHPNISYMYIAALDDDDVPSELMCNSIERHLKSINHPKYEIYRYPGAGHLIEAPFNPHCKELFFRPFDVCLSYGGTSLAHCRAQEHSWSKQIDFLRRNLTDKARL